MKNRYLQESNLYDFRQTSSVINAYLDEKILNILLRAWIQLKEHAGMKQRSRYKMPLKANPTSRSNILVYSRESEGSDNESHRKIRYLTAEDEEYEQLEGLPTPKYNFDFLNFSQKSHTPDNTVLIKGKNQTSSEHQTTEQFQDIILERLGQLENNFQLIKTMRSKSSNYQFYNDFSDRSNGLVSKQDNSKLSRLRYIKMNDKDSNSSKYVKEEAQYSIVDNFVQKKTLQPSYSPNQMQNHQVPKLRFKQNNYSNKRNTCQKEVSQQKSYNKYNQPMNKTNERISLYSTVINSRTKNLSIKSSKTENRSLGKFYRKSRYNMKTLGEEEFSENNNHQDQRNSDTKNKTDRNQHSKSKKGSVLSQIVKKSKAKTQSFNQFKIRQNPECIRPAKHVCKAQIMRPICYGYVPVICCHCSPYIHNFQCQPSYLQSLSYKNHHNDNM